MFVHEINGVLDSCPFPVYDARGNMVLTIARTGTSETNPAYASSNRRAFDVWGSVRASAELGTPTNKQRYCANLGHVEDDDSGLIYMRARYYEPWTGRFVSEDRNPDDFVNLYSYVRNQPTTFVDESGNDALPILLNVISTLLFITYAILEGMQANFEKAFASVYRDLDRAMSIIKITGERADDLLKRIGSLNIDDLGKRAEAARNGARKARVGKFAALGAAILTRALGIYAFLIDIDIAADGYGGFETVFGD